MKSSERRPSRDFQLAKDNEYSFLIYRDEDGVTSIHFPSLTSAGETMTTRATVKYDVLEKAVSETHRPDYLRAGVALLAVTFVP